MISVYAIPNIKTGLIKANNNEEIIMKKIATTILVSSLALGGFTLANADYDRNDRHERSEHKGKYCDKHGKKSGYRMEKMIKHLGLSEEQAKQVHNIRDSYKGKMQAAREKMQENRKQLREEMHAESIDKSKIKELAQTAGKIKSNKIILRAEMRNEIHKVLTKEQREKMKKQKEYRGSNYKHDHHS